MSMSELENVKGRGWDDVDVRVPTRISNLPQPYALLTPITALSDGVINGGGLDGRSSAARLLRNWALDISMTARRRYWYGSVTQAISDVVGESERVSVGILDSAGNARWGSCTVAFVYSWLIRLLRETNKVADVGRLYIGMCCVSAIGEVLLPAVS